MPIYGFMPKIVHKHGLQAKILQFYVQKHIFYERVGEGDEKNFENAPSPRWNPPS